MDIGSKIYEIFNRLINKLGSVAFVDVVPVSKGGTNSTTITNVVCTSSDVTIAPLGVTSVTIPITDYANIKILYGVIELYATSASSGTMNTGYVQLVGWYVSSGNVVVKARNPLSSENVKCKFVVNFKCAK